jgi:hypothetical protein
MLMIRRLSLVGAAAAAVALVACSSDSTAPKPLTSQQVAQDIDQVFAADLAAGTSEDSGLASAIAEFVESGPAYGGTESSVSVTTGTGKRTWHGVGYVVSEEANDTVFVGALYPNRNLDTLVITEVENDNGSSDIIVIATTTAFATGGDTTATSASASLLSASGTCSLQSGLVADNTLAAGWSGSTCTAAKFQMSLTVTLPTAVGLGSLSFSNTTFNGPLFTFSGPSRVVGIPSKGAAMAARLRALAKRMRA